MPEKSVVPALCMRQSFPLFEQFAGAAQGWEFNFLQLSRATEAFKLEQFASARLLYSRAAFACRFHQMGGPVLSYRTFALHAPKSTDYRWCGESINRHCLIVMPEGGEFESVTEAGFDVLTLSLSNELLEDIAESAFQRPLSSFIGRAGQVCRLPGNNLRALRGLLVQLSNELSGCNRQNSALRGNFYVRHLEKKLAMLVLGCLDGGDSQVARGARTRRMKRLERAFGAIGSESGGSLGVPELTERVGGSRRSLELAFQEFVGLSPAAYMKAVRLKRLHQDLLAHDACTSSVRKLCTAHGFDQQGQLAEDYRKYFGELPSVTLRRT